MRIDTIVRKRSLGQLLSRDIRVNRYVYVMLLPVVAYYVIFHYGPMYGAQIAFKEFSPSRGIIGSRWVARSGTSRIPLGLAFCGPGLHLAGDWCCTRRS